MYVVIRIRGRMSITKEIEDTLKMLRLHKKMHCVLLKNDDKVIRGMIQKVKDYITWGEISDENLKLLIQKRGRKAANKRLTVAEAEVIYDKVKAEKKMVLGAKPVFRLSPPSKGFKKSTKQNYPKGEIGYRAEKINELLKRMI